MPTKEAFIMTVYMANWKDNSIQVFCNYTGSKMYWRTWQAYGDVWGAWRQVIGSNGGNVTINNRLQLTGTQYPQIYGNGTSLQLGVDTNAAVGVVLQGGVFREAGDGSLNLGNGSHRWAVVYAKTGSINTSDRNEKNTIADIDPEQAEKLIMGLKPSTFKFNDGTSGRTHWGLISQDIEELLPQIGMSDLDFAGFIKTPKTEDYYEDVPETVTDEETGEEKTVTRKELKTRTVEGEYVYALRYSEFIAPLICMVQKQQKQIENLERRLSALENKEEA
ncbi:MAG: tail fiber domain-containing protein, partial [Clostridiaceae bacterium]|nr:tail fiber domain-containing protein [Clostridiaceae bacterium]